MNSSLPNTNKGLYPANMAIGEILTELKTKKSHSKTQISLFQLQFRRN